MKYDLILYVGQLELADFLFEGWVIYPYEHGLLDGPGGGGM